MSSFLVKGNIFAEFSKSLILNFVSFWITSSSILVSIAEIILSKSISICSRISFHFPLLLSETVFRVFLLNHDFFFYLSSVYIYLF